MDLYCMRNKTLKSIFYYTSSYMHDSQDHPFTLLEREPATFINVDHGTKFDIKNINIIAHMLNFTIAAVAQTRQ